MRAGELCSVRTRFAEQSDSLTQPSSQSFDLSDTTTDES